MKKRYRHKRFPSVCSVLLLYAMLLPQLIRRSNIQQKDCDCASVFTEHVIQRDHRMVYILYYVLSVFVQAGSVVEPRFTFEILLSIIQDDHGGNKRYYLYRVNQTNVGVPLVLLFLLMQSSTPFLFWVSSSSTFSNNLDYRRGIARTKVCSNIYPSRGKRPKRDR